MRTILKLAFAIAVCGNVWAHESEPPLDWSPSWYAGASATENAFGDWSVIEQLNDGSYGAPTEDDEATGYRLFGGVDFLGHFALEAGYSDFGEASFQADSDGSGSFWNAGPVQDRVEVNGLDLSVLGKLRVLRNTAIVGQVGALRWESQMRASGSTQSNGPAVVEASDDGVELLYGARVEYDGLPALRVIGAYARSGFDAFFNDTNLETFSLSLAYRF